jgi:hypothetical protein
MLNNLQRIREKITNKIFFKILLLNKLKTANQITKQKQAFVNIFIKQIKSLNHQIMSILVQSKIKIQATIYMLYQSISLLQ